MVYNTRMSGSSFQIGSRTVGAGNPIFVIAELSANHVGSLDTALALIDAAAASGVSAIKLQHYRPETLTVKSELPEFRIGSGSLWDGRYLFDLYEEAMMPWEWTETLVSRARSLGLEWFSSPFDSTAVDFLEQFDPPAYKIASFELVDLPLIRLVASTGKPLVLSTGMASLDEIDEAVGAAREAGCRNLVLLRCNSGYPASPDEMDLASIPVMRARYGCEVGLSDHTLGTMSAVASVCLGGVMVEKHLTLSRSTGGADSTFSTEPREMRELISQVGLARSVLGSERFGPSAREELSLAFRRSLRASRAIGKGELISSDNVGSFRPAGGLHPDRMQSLIGMRVVRDVRAGEAILDELLD